MNSEQKMIIYQTLPRLFGNRNRTCRKNGSLSENGTGKMADYTYRALHEIRQLGVTHIWYTGIIEHATQTGYPACGIARDHGALVKGIAGSPYAIRDYYDVDPDLAENVACRMAEFEALVERTHRSGMKVIIDFVANHVARHYYSDAKPITVNNLGRQDNTFTRFDPNNNFYYLPGQALTLHFDAGEEDFEYSEFPAKATGNNCFSLHPSRDDWYDTVKLNYGVDCAGDGSCHFDPVPDTWIKMLDILLFWAGKGVDGFRCDMAEMVPVEFWSWVIPRAGATRDLCFIAEIYRPELYRDYLHAHFDYLYDKVGLYDTLRDVICGRAGAAAITHCWQSVEDIRDHMLHFLENHDEQRIASDFFAGSPEAGFPGLMVAATLHTNPLMIYFGQELGERGMDEEGYSGRDGRTTIFDYWSLESIRNWMNGGLFDGALLTAAQQTLRQACVRLLNVVCREPAIVKGVFFDLMYVNRDNPHFNDHRQYAFLRKHEQEVLLIVVNFDPAEQTVRVIIPPVAFCLLHIPDNQPAIRTDLLTGEQSLSTLTEACPYETTLPGYSGKLLKFKYGFMQTIHGEALL
ncbi:MAG: alpha-amylase [Tannerella sp.]|jgi:glycosidase|nr:alpha-amylase [Tannerella sp.]